MNTIDDGLRTLMNRGFLFQHLRDLNHNVRLIIGSYAWGEFYDRIQITDENNTIAARALMDSGPGRDEVVWSYEGDALSTIAALLDLPKPHQPGAPRRTIRTPSALWLPGTGTPPSLPGLTP